MDGLLRGRIFNTLNTIQLYKKNKNEFLSQQLTLSYENVTIPTPHPTVPLRPSKVIDSNKSNKEQPQVLIDLGLQDVNPKINSVNTLLLLTQQQRKDFEKVAETAEKLSVKLTNEENRFLKTNLIAQTNIMVSLSGCYEHLILARIFLALQQEELAVAQLRQASLYLDQIEKTRTLLTETDKWKYWYRGEDKMNMNNLDKKMKSVLSLFVNNQM